MTEIRVKTALKERFDDIDLNKGIKGALLNDFYKKHSGTFRYKSIRAILKGLECPNSMEYIGEYPAAHENNWTHECQGVTHDDKNWFITQDLYINIASVTRDLKSMDTIGFIPPDLLTLGYNHYGDLDYYEGNLYIPLEGEDAGLDAKILVFSTAIDTTTIPRKPIIPSTSASLSPSPHKSASWCAINPVDGFLYTSDFNNVSFLYVYERMFTPSGELRLTLLGGFNLFDRKGTTLLLQRIQGGAFSKNGHLYLVSDDTANIGDSGIHIFDMITGRRAFHKWVDYDSSEPAPEELEGIDIWDLDSGSSSEIAGQIHLIMLDNDWGPDGNDDVYFKHFRVPRNIV